MSDLVTLFFELVRVAIGTQDCLSRLPKNAEWNELFDMAVKQSLVGVCFVGIHRLGADSDEGFAQIGMSEYLFFTWMGMAAQINMKNEIVNQQCVSLQKRLSANGFRSCILKGQGVAALYGPELSGFRQSGDIDIWIEGDRDKALNYFKKQGYHVAYTSIKHAQVNMYDDTEVEAHSRPSWFYSPIHNRRWMKWVKRYEERQFGNAPVGGIVAPTADFNLVFLLIHIYRHLFEEGVGLRQVMDYYFALSASYFEKCHELSMNCSFSSILKQLGLERFAGALMWIIKTVFVGHNNHNDNFFHGIELNEKGGILLLEEIMHGGNFGKYDERNGERKENRIVRGLVTMKRNMRYISSYPSEILWAPVWKLWHWCWRRKHGYI